MTKAPVHFRHRRSRRVSLTTTNISALKAEIEAKTNFKDFCGKAPKMNPSRDLITDHICGM